MNDMEHGTTRVRTGRLEKSLVLGVLTAICITHSVYREPIQMEMKEENLDNHWIKTNGFWVTNCHVQAQSSRHEDRKSIVQNFWNLLSKGKQKLLANYSEKYYLGERLLNCFAGDDDFSENSFAENINSLSYEKPRSNNTCLWVSDVSKNGNDTWIVSAKHIYLQQRNSKPCVGIVNLEFLKMSNVMTDSKAQTSWVSPLIRRYRDVKQFIFPVIPHRSKLIKNLDAVSKQLASLFLALLDIFDFLPEHKESYQQRDFILNMPDSLLFASFSKTVRA